MRSTRSQSFKIIGDLGKSQGCVVHKVEFVYGSYKGVRALKVQNKGKRPEYADEVSIHKKLSHRNIVKCYGSFTDSDFEYIVLELCTRSLRDLLEIRGRLPYCDIFTYSKGILCGIGYIHDQGFIHGDIKPSNILVATDWSFKIADFGLAINPQRFTKLPISGTQRYMAPELSNGEKYTSSIDIWSFGVVLIDMGAPSRSRFPEYTGSWPSLEEEPMDSSIEDLVLKLLVEAPKRYTLDNILNHPFISEGPFPNR